MQIAESFRCAPNSATFVMWKPIWYDIVSSLLHPSEKLDRQRKSIAHAAVGLYHSRQGRISIELAPEPKDLHIYATIKYVFVDAVACSRCSRVSGRCGASGNAVSSAYSPLVSATGTPCGSVSRRAGRSGCQPPNL